MQYSLYWPATIVHPLVWLVTRQAHYSQPSVTSSPYIRQHRLHAGEQRPQHFQPAHLPSCTGASNKLQSAPKLSTCCQTQFKDATGEKARSFPRVLTCQIWLL